MKKKLVAKKLLKNGKKIEKFETLWGTLYNFFFYLNLKKEAIAHSVFFGRYLSGLG
jgi:hypothetical protein